MIQLPTKAQLKTLRAWKKPDSLSIYSPYIKPNSPDNNPNRTQVKNFLKEARQMLLAKKLDERQIDTILQPVKKLLDSHEFRMNYKNSLVIFIGQDFFQYYRLPTEGITQSITIGTGFNIKPIVKLLDESSPYFVLLLSHNGVRLLKGDDFNIESVKEFPTAMKQDLKIDEYPNERQTHTVAPVAQGKGSEKFHGQYNETQVDKDMLIKYFRHIDTKVQKIIKNEKIPLIIAGVEYLLPIYRQANTYPHLLEKEIQGNLEHSSLDSIREQVYKLLI